MVQDISKWSFFLNVFSGVFLGSELGFAETPPAIHSIVAAEKGMATEVEPLLIRKDKPTGPDVLIDGGKKPESITSSGALVWRGKSQSQLDTQMRPRVKEEGFLAQENDMSERENEETTREEAQVKSETISEKDSSANEVEVEEIYTEGYAEVDEEENGALEWEDGLAEEVYRSTQEKIAQERELSGFGNQESQFPHQHVDSVLNSPLSSEEINSKNTNFNPEYYNLSVREGAAFFDGADNEGDGLMEDEWDSYMGPVDGSSTIDLAEQDSGFFDNSFNTPGSQEASREGGSVDSSFTPSSQTAAELETANHFAELPFHGE